MQRIKVIDSHTGGEPTRIVVDGGPDLGDGTLEERRKIFSEHFDEIRSAIVNEPRGSDVLVGGLLCEPVDPASAAGVIYFTTAGFLGMCGHGTIGLVTTLKYLNRIEVGRHQIETPVGMIHVELGEDGRVSVQNVPSYRLLQDVKVDVPDYGTVTGDVAWGGNWFFLVKDCNETLTLKNADRLTHLTRRIRESLNRESITGVDGAYIDHVELYAPPADAQNQSRNFVLCPGGDYDRSPCGTGTSAKLACLAADQVLAPGQVWRQESIVGSVFECSYEPGENGSVIPTIRGYAHISGENTLILDPSDPFCMGIRS